MLNKIQIEGWHRRLAQVTGALSMCLTKRKLSPADLPIWARRLEEIASEMKSSQPVRRETNEG